MKTTSRKALFRLVGLLLMVVVMASEGTTRVNAAQNETEPKIVEEVVTEQEAEQESEQEAEPETIEETEQETIQETEQEAEAESQQETEQEVEQETKSGANLNAGAAKIIDSIDFVTEEELVEFAKEYEEKYSLVMANVQTSMNIRQEPTANSTKVGLLYADCGGTILERTQGWTKIQSGNLVGWASNEYLLFGEEALQMAEMVGIYKATVNVSGLNIRKEPSTEAGIWAQAEQGGVYEAITDHTTDEWVAIEYGGALGYISAEYITMEFTIDHGETLEEIKERERREREERQQLIVKEGTSVIGTTDEMLLAALIYMEAGNQPYEGQVAVGAVVMNRVNSPAYPDTIAGVIYASGQFTPTVTGRVEELAVSGVSESCIQAARAAMNGESPVGGAMHFRRVGKHQGQVIGDHVFW